MTTAGEPWLLNVEDVSGKLDVDPKRGLTAAEAKLPVLAQAGCLARSLGGLIS